MLGFGVDDCFTSALIVGSGVIDAGILWVTLVGNTMVGGNVGSGSKMPPIMLHPDITIINKIKKMIFNCIVVRLR